MPQFHTTVNSTRQFNTAVPHKGHSFALNVSGHDKCVSFTIKRILFEGCDGFVWNRPICVELMDLVELTCGFDGFLLDRRVELTDFGG